MHRWRRTIAADPALLGRVAEMGWFSTCFHDLVTNANRLGNIWRLSQSAFFGRL
jgi:hypothetical protein